MISRASIQWVHSEKFASSQRRPAARPPTYRSRSSPRPRTSSSPAIFVSFSSLSWSVWLFTRSDIKTIIAPSFIFGVLNAFSAHALNLPAASIIHILARAPLTLLWIWLNLLPFNIDNQRRPESIEEDRVNKPWRTLPSGRMTPRQATVFMAVFYGLAVATSVAIGGLRQCVSLLALGYTYNSVGGSEKAICRNLINALGFLCFASGALEVTLGYKLPFARSIASISQFGVHSDSQPLALWLSVIAGIVFTTVQTQDMYDQEGDGARGRMTIPIWLGDATARWTIIAPMGFWCLFCPWLWGAGLVGHVLYGALGLSVAVRCYTLRTVKDDKTTFLLWNVWMGSVYALPALKASGLI